LEEKLKKQIVFRPSLVKAMIQISSTLLKAVKDELDELNFFPVPDKDTGKNAFLVLEGMVKAISEKDYANLTELIDDLLESAQDNARGNIGIAISNGFVGFFSVLEKEGKSYQEVAPELWQWIKQVFSEEADEAKIKIVDGKLLAKALAAGFDMAYHGFNPPEKKTVLDVMEATKTEASAQVESGEEDPSVILEKAIVKARKALAETKGKIHKGKTINTEDAGAAAFIPILEAFLQAFAEKKERPDEK